MGEDRVALNLNKKIKKYYGLKIFAKIIIFPALVPKNDLFEHKYRWLHT